MENDLFYPMIYFESNPMQYAKEDICCFIFRGIRNEMNKYLLTNEGRVILLQTLAICTELGLWVGMTSLEISSSTYKTKSQYATFLCQKT